MCVNRWQRLVVGFAIACAIGGCRERFDEVTTDASPMVGGPDAARFDAPPAPTLKVIEGATEIRVEVPNRFAISFFESGNWQPQRWTDASRGDADLSGAGNDAGASSIVTPLIVCSATCVGAPDMVGASLIVESQDDSSVILKLEWSWMLGSIPLAGQARYTIGVDGTWVGESSVTNNAVVTLSGSMEVADTHVSESLTWRVTEDMDSDFFGFTIPGADELDPIGFEVQFDAPIDVTIESDEPNNRYFLAPLNLAADETSTVSWTAKIWRDS